MKRSGWILGVISLVLTWTALVASTIWTTANAVSTANEITDQKLLQLRLEQDGKITKINDTLTKIREDVAAIRTKLEGGKNLGGQTTVTRSKETAMMKN